MLPTAITIQGTHYEMGRQHGVQVRPLRSQIARAVEARFDQIQQQGPDARFEQLVQDTRDVLQEFDAPLLSMLRGLAETLDLDYDTLLRYDLVTYLRDDLVTRAMADEEGCTTWGAVGSATTSGDPILVKNRDNRLELLPIQIVVTASPESGYRYLCSSSGGKAGVSCAGINEAGLTVADTHVCSTDLGPGLPDYALMMHILEEHDTVSSALDYLRSVPRLGRNNLILVDAGGHLAVFEIGHRSCGQLDTHDGTLVNTNHFVTPELQDCFVDVSPPQVRGNTYHRHDKVTQALSGAWGHIDVRFARRLMAAHDGPLASICRHPMQGSQAATLSTSIFSPARREMLFCHGLPCQSEYERFLV
jgi:predicted choloylglycine hydrolase